MPNINNYMRFFFTWYHWIDEEDKEVKKENNENNYTIQLNLFRLVVIIYILILKKQINGSSVSK